MKRFIVLVASLVMLSLACTVSTTNQASPTIDLLEAAQQTMAAAPSSTPLEPTFAPTNTEIPTQTPLPGPAACVSLDAPIQVGLTTNIVDGATIDVLIDGQEHRVRYIGIDKPVDQLQS